MTDDNDDLGDARRRRCRGRLGFEPAVSATGADDAEVGGADSRAATGSPPSRGGAGLRRRRGRRRGPAGRARLDGRRLRRCSPRPPARSSTRPRTPTSPPAASSTRPAASPATARTCRASRASGPSLIGVGSAAVYFQVSTGRMPAGRAGRLRAAQGSEVQRGADRAARRLRPVARRRPAAFRPAPCGPAAPSSPTAASCSGSTARRATARRSRARRCRPARSRRR